MLQQGQVFELSTRGRDGGRLWAYRLRVGGRGSRRIQRGGFPSEQDARDALKRELERIRRERRIPRSLTLSELVETDLRSARRAAGNDQEAALAARQGDRRVR